MKDKEVFTPENLKKYKDFLNLQLKAQLSVTEIHYLPNDIGNHPVQPISVYEALEDVPFISVDDLFDNYDEYMRILQELADKKDPREIKNLGFLLKIPNNKYLAFAS